jgi:AraC-like DNA-binding protein
VSQQIELLRGMVEFTGNEDLGLHAAQATHRGDYAVLEYVAASCRSAAEATALIRRYIGLVNDATEVTLDIINGRAVSRWVSSVPLIRAAADFQIAAVYVAVERWFPLSGIAHEVCFMHPQPADLTEYKNVFKHAQLRFGASFDGFAFDMAMLDRPLPASDPKLHELLTRHAEQMLAELPSAQSLSRRVRALIVPALQHGDATAENIAAQLHISRRTLTRQLEAEGTTFKELLAELRRALAMRYLETTALGTTEIALLLGFSETAAFHRAFKRWTKRTPLEYRRLHSA